MRRNARTFGVALTAAMFAFLSLTAMPALAYQKYTDGCQSCHGGFRSSSSSEKPGNTWPRNLHDRHRYDMLSGSSTCKACHVINGDNPNLNASGGVTGLPGYGCVGCHGRDYNGTVSGVGLRLHHNAHGVTSCLGCHDSDPAPKAENVLPPYYGKTGVKITGSCNTDGTENWTSDGLGLDNDGDDTYDTNDTDCVVGTPDIAINPTSLAFGNVPVGTTPTLSVIVTNVGTAILSVTNLTLTGSADFHFSNPPTVPFNLAAGAGQSLTIAYAPAAAGADSGALEIRSNDPDESLVTVPLSGTGVVCDINVTPLTLVFGQVTQGNTKTLMVTIGNTGSLDCQVSALTPTGSADFALGAGAPIPPFPVTPGSSLMVPVDYTPSNVGGDSGNLAIGSDDPDEGTVNVSLSGTGGAPPTGCDIDVTPLTLSFGQVRVGNPKTLKVTIGNLGDTNCIVSALVLTNNADFALVSPPATPLIVAPGATVEVSVNYTPSSVSDDLANLLIQSDDPDEGQVNVSLTGSGVECNIGVNPVALDFGTVTIGSFASRTATITNSGQVACLVTSVVLSASLEFDFAASTPAPPFAVPPQSSTNVVVVYTPADANTDAGSLLIGSEDPDTPLVTVSLTGTGKAPVLECDIAVNPTNLVFGTVAVGTNATLLVEISNTGNAACTVSGLELSGATAFVLGSGAPATPFVVSPGSPVQVAVVFAPASADAAVGNLKISSDDPDKGIVNVALNGTGAVCDLTVTPNGVDFGSVAIGTTASRVVSLVNNGGASCTVTSLALSGSAEFVVNGSSPALPIVVGAMTMVDVAIDYAPVNVGDDAGTLTVGSTDPDLPTQTVTLAGAGFEQTAVVDLDIQKFHVKRRYKIGKKKPIQIWLKVRNEGPDNEPRLATVIGWQDGEKVYEESQWVAAEVNRGTEKYEYPGYWPVEDGEIQWTATIADDDSDDDSATSTTTVKSRKSKSDDNESDDR